MRPTVATMSTRYGRIGDFSFSHRLLSRENRITLNIDPISGSCGNVTPQAIFLVVGGHLFVRRVSFEERPPPSITPQGVIGIPVLFVLDHDEPLFRPFRPM